MKIPEYRFNYVNQIICTKKIGSRLNYLIQLPLKLIKGLILYFFEARLIDPHG